MVSAFEALTNALFRLPGGTKDARWIVHSGSIFGNFEDSPIKRRGLCPHFRLPVENHKKYANEAAKQIGECAHFRSVRNITCKLIKSGPALFLI